MGDLGEPQQSHYIITGKSGSPLGDDRFKQKLEDSILERKRKLQGKQTANLTTAERMKKTAIMEVMTTAACHMAGRETLGKK